jgi:hypothetical protein
LPNSSDFHGLMEMSNTASTPVDAIPTFLVNPGGEAVGYQQITNLSSAVALSPPTGAMIAVIIPEGEAVRWRDDGVAPTSTVGMPLAVGQQLIYARDLAALSFIQQSATAKLSVSYYG